MGGEKESRGGGAGSGEDTHRRGRGRGVGAGLRGGREESEWGRGKRERGVARAARKGWGYGAARAG